MPSIVVPLTAMLYLIQTRLKNGYAATRSKRSLWTRRQLFNSDKFIQTFNTLKLVYESDPDSFTVVPDVGLKCTSPGVSNCADVHRSFDLSFSQPSQGFYINIQADCTSGQILNLTFSDDNSIEIVKHSLDCETITGVLGYFGFVLSRTIANVKWNRPLMTIASLPWV
jgi:hypothetical protein